MAQKVKSLLNSTSSYFVVVPFGEAPGKVAPGVNCFMLIKLGKPLKNYT